jgi:predicted solute-binding protein
MALRLGVVQESWLEPLFRGFSAEVEVPADEPAITVVTGTPAQLADLIANDNLEAAFLTPLDYAVHASRLQIIPGVCASSTGESGIVRIQFKEEANTIASLAAFHALLSDTSLARIVLAENQELFPQIFTVDSIADEILSRVDGIVYAGDPSFKHPELSGKFDLAEEWFDLAELPFVHGFWVAREDILTPIDVKAILRRSAIGIAAALENKDGNAEENPISFELDELALSAIREFFQLAFYHGILKDIPELKFVPLISSN